jgi:hypothetical protein
MSIKNEIRKKQLSYYIGKDASCSLLTIALNVHMFAVGSLDSTEEHMIQDYNFLKWVVEEAWYEQPDRYKEFSDAVKNVILVALGEFEKDMEIRRCHACYKREA